MIAHLGDITKIDGLNVPIVDCVIGGSPCQDLSVAGKRAGLAGTPVRSLHGANQISQRNEATG